MRGGLLIFTGALLVAACDGTSNPNAGPGYTESQLLDFVHFSEDFTVGPRPMTVLLVRHAQPSELELENSRLVGRAWLDGLKDHRAQWRLGVLPVGATQAAVPLGELVQAESGGYYVHGGNTDPDGLLEELLDPVEGTPGQNPVFTTISAMAGVPANDDFFLQNGLFVVHVISSQEDKSQEGAADELEDWLREDTYYGWGATEFNASTNLSSSPCIGGVSDDLLDMVAAIGGFQQDICDDTAPARAATTYTSSMTNYSMKLSARPYQFTIEVKSVDWMGPDLELDRDFDYTAYDNEVKLTSWQPPDLTRVWVEYVPML